MSPLVEPPIACSTTCALRNEAAVSNSLGFGPFALAITAATLPLASAERRREPAVDGFDFNVVNFAGAIFSPQPPAIRARPQHFALVMPDHHRPHGNDNGRQIGTDRGHDLRR